MSIPPDSSWRGVAAFLPQPVNDHNAARFVEDNIVYYNVSHNIVTRPLAHIKYRSSDGDLDIRRHVFRWDRASYDLVFQNGLKTNRQANTPDAVFFNLEHYVSDTRGRPIDTRDSATHSFISTTISTSWYPRVSNRSEHHIYRYEIYAPGGICVAETLGERYRYPVQDEVAFPNGIAPQYIRSAQLFLLTGDGRDTRRTRVNNLLYINTNFNPQSHPQRQIRIQRPVVNYRENNATKRLIISYIPPRDRRAVASNATNIIEYYTEGVTTIKNYLDSAFCSSRTNEAYLFFQNEYVLINYAPGGLNDRVINGPLYIPNGFHSLVGTPFAAYGIDAAFSCRHNRNNQSFIFSGSICAKIDYAPGTTNDKILEGPKAINEMFPFFKGTNFEKGVDAAFESTVNNEVYIFKGGEYALIDYIQQKLIAIRPIVDGFKCLRNTIFDRDIGAAFASHRSKEAYLFKENSYVLLHFTPGETKDRISGPKEINWPSLVNILRRDNAGLDIYEGPSPDPQRVHDEL